jgi:hypothetical protein
MHNSGNAAIPICWKDSATQFFERVSSTTRRRDQSPARLMRRRRVARR